jgi:hypothetical protein
MMETARSNRSPIVGIVLRLTIGPQVGKSSASGGFDGTV